MSATRKEIEEEINLNQMKMDMDVLIKSINSKSEHDIAICEVGTKLPRFEISVEYPPYNEGRHKFQRYISIREVEEIARNIYHNINDLHGYGYEEKCFELVDVIGSSIHKSYISLDADWEREILRKRIHIIISFRRKS